jgi:hypothetical protein
MNKHFFYSATIVLAAALSSCTYNKPKENQEPDPLASHIDSSIKPSSRTTIGLNNIRFLRASKAMVCGR